MQVIDLNKYLGEMKPKQHHFFFNVSQKKFIAKYETI